MKLPDFKSLKSQFEGELSTDFTTRQLYATDASAYREIPIAVATPASDSDIRALILFANANKLSLIPRAAGTSLAGQVVGGGIVVDISCHFTKILEVNVEENWVRVQPGVIRDELNQFLKPYGLMFGPETSTANRAMIGGMIGNNSCGSNSIVYGSTRDHLLEVAGYLSDGSDIKFGSISPDELHQKTQAPSLEGRIYNHIYKLLSDQTNRKSIEKEFPKPSIHRRNTGYAIDLLKDTSAFGDYARDFNLCQLIAGSEGTLMFVTEAKLSLNKIPEGEKGLLCVHFSSVNDALKGNLIGLKYQPYASELMDHHILERTKDNISYRQNRFFVKGDPQAILVIELLGKDSQDLHYKAQQLTVDLKGNGLGYHFPLVTGSDMVKVWNLRKAGLGLLSNIPGDAKPAPIIEDTAVDVNDLPAYIEDFNKILDQYGLYCVHYAHAGSGELHLRPILNLKTKEGHALFRTVLDEIARLVKKYNGSLSGEHGDGRLRGEFIPFMLGDENYNLLKSIKNTWDPLHIFNPGKIVDTPPMDTSLRFEAGQETPDFKTLLDFSENQGYLRAVEQCNGSGDCRKTHLSGGVMCPSYMATKNEKDTTRARANLLREVLTRSKKTNAFDSEEIKDILDLCLSCKGCKSECPSNVDMGKLKAEFQYQYYQSNGIPLRTRLVAHFTKMNQMASRFPGLYNVLIKNNVTSSFIKWFVGFAKKRNIPALHNQTLRNWYEQHYKPLKAPKREVYFFCDEFTNYNDTHVGIKAIKLLHKLGIQVHFSKHGESGRTFLSKGLLKQAKNVAIRNVSHFDEIVNADIPLIGIEPSAILTFRDEYPDIVGHDFKHKALQLAKNTFTIDEYLDQLIRQGEIDNSFFTDATKKIKLHGHCHQKALGTVSSSQHILSLPTNYEVEVIQSGCCGMAGSFGYEKEHYDISMQIGELVLFPAVRKATETTLIAAPGTSCRHQIFDGTKREGLHPVEILYDALL